MIVVPTDTPGLDIKRDIPCMSAPEPTPGLPGNHCEVLYREVRVPFDHVIGGDAGVGQGFALAQRRLGPGRIHHAMRWLGQCQRAFDAMCERAVSRRTAGSLLADKQLVQDMVAESWAEMQAARLVTMQAAWKMDKLVAAGGHNSDARLEIGVIKFWGARVLHNVIDPLDPGVRLAGLQRRHAVGGDVPPGPRRPDPRRAGRGAQGERGPVPSEGLPAGRDANRACPTRRAAAIGSSPISSTSRRSSIDVALARPGGPIPPPAPPAPEDGSATAPRRDPCWLGRR